MTFTTTISLVTDIYHNNNAFFTYLIIFKFSIVTEYHFTTKGKVSQIAPATLFCCRLLHISPQSYSVTPCDNEVLQSVAV